MRPFRSNRLRFIAVAAGFLLVGGVLYALLRHLGAVALMMAGIAFFGFAWRDIAQRFRQHPAWRAEAAPPDSSAPRSGPSAARVPVWAWVAMGAMTAVLAYFLSSAALRGAEDSRMLWAFHEDEGWIGDLYQNYVGQEQMDLGKQWGYTYGSLNLMVVSLVARAVRPLVRLDGAQCVILNRFLLEAALLAAGWAVFGAGVRFLRSAGAGLVAAGLLWTNVKVVEMALLANYPDILGMLLLFLAFWSACEIYLSMRPVHLFAAPLLLGIGFSAKFMGLPLALVILAAFWLGLRETARRWPSLSRRQFRVDLVRYAAYVPAAMAAAFAIVNPYYILRLRLFLSQMHKVLSLYGTGNINNLPASAVRQVTPADWWHVATGSGALEWVLVLGVCVSLGAAVVAVFRRRKFQGAMPVFLVFGGAFAVAWIGFVLWSTRFAFFHYFLPIVPIVYLMACAAPKSVAAAMPAARPGMVKGLVAAGLAALVLGGLLPLMGDVAAVRQGASEYAADPLGYAARQSLLRSRLARTWQLVTRIRNTRDSEAVEVGRWLAEHCPQARTLVTNETVFYYPPSIEHVFYWNRQMSLGLLFRTMPDLLIVSDWFVEMYTQDLESDELAAMPEPARQTYLDAHEFYSLLKDKDEFLDYRRIKVFTAPGGWYWKRLHVYQRMGPANLGGLVKKVRGTALEDPPHGAGCLSFAGPLQEADLYLAAAPGSPGPARLEVVLESAVELSGLGVAWYSPQDLPARAFAEGWLGGAKVFECELPIEGRSAPYSWVELDAKPAVDRLVLRVSEFRGRNQLLLRRIFLRTDATP